MLFFYLFVLVSLVGAVAGAAALSSGAMALVWGVLLFAGIFLGLLVVLFLVLLVSSWFVDLSVEQKERSRYFGFLCDQLFALALLLAGVRVHTKGLELVPRDRPFLLVSNHISDLDPVIFIHQMPWAKLSFIAKKETYQMFLINKFIHKLQCLAIDRENDREALKTIIRAAQLLRKGEHSLGVFPEGYENKSGELLPFRNGVFKIAQRAQVPIVVCVLHNTNVMMKNLFRRRTDVTVEVLGVVETEEHTGVLTRDVGDRIHKMMAVALGQEAE